MKKAEMKMVILTRNKNSYSKKIAGSSNRESESSLRLLQTNDWRYVRFQWN